MRPRKHNSNQAHEPVDLGPGPKSPYWFLDIEWSDRSDTSPESIRSLDGPYPRISIT